MIGRIAIIGFTTIALGVSARGALTSTRTGLSLLDDSVSPAGARDYTRFQTLREEFSTTVPADSRIYIDGGPDGPWATQRLTEIAVMNGVSVTLDIAESDYVVSIVEVAEEISAGGYHLVVEPTGETTP